MIDFIIVDDEMKFGKIIENNIDRFFIKGSIDYKTHLFRGFNNDLNLLIKNEYPKIYFLDIEMEGISGIGIARRIRECDPDSIIIFVTSHNEKTYEVLKAQISALDFIFKKDISENILNSIIRTALKNLYSDKKIITKSSGITYITYIKDIYCVIKNSADKNCIIKTNKGDIFSTKTLTEIQDLSKGYLFKSHRSCLINVSRVEYIDWQSSKILFDNNEHVFLLARDKKKVLKNYVKC